MNSSVSLHCRTQSSSGRATELWEHEMDTVMDDLSRAIAMHGRGDVSGAADACRDILERDGTQAGAWHLAGVIAHQVGRHSEAVRHITRALEFDPQNADFWNNLAAVCIAMGSAEAAHECAVNAVKLRPDFAEAYNHLGTALRNAGRVPEAVEAYRRALALQPGCAAFHGNIAGAYQELGEFDQSLHHYQEALRLNPTDASTYFNLSDWVQRGRFQFSTEQVAQIESLLGTETLAVPASIQLCFAAARSLDRQGAFARAFSMLERGNALRAQWLVQNGIRFDSKEHASYIGRIMATFDRSYFARSFATGLTNELPIFIVGMPRSGTTLVEQILSSHPRIFGAGELDAIPRLAIRIAAELSSADEYPECFRVADPLRLRETAQRHLVMLQNRAPHATRITDKLPGNIIHLGLIATLFPGARVVHCRRDPLDVCFSCFAQNFTSDDVAAFCCSLDSLGAYYLEYERIARHWASVLPLRMFELHYETLVQSPNRVIRDLIQFCDVPWDERCLEFHANRRTVRTASSLQVREPIYDSSIGRWKRYASELESLREVLHKQGSGLQICNS